MEGWVSGLNQRFAKPSTSAMGSASSNLAPSATRPDSLIGKTEDYGSFDEGSAPSREHISVSNMSSLKCH